MNTHRGVGQRVDLLGIEMEVLGVDERTRLLGIPFTNLSVIYTFLVARMEGSQPMVTMLRVDTPLSTIHGAGGALTEARSYTAEGRHADAAMSKWPSQ